MQKQIKKQSPDEAYAHWGFLFITTIKVSLINIYYLGWTAFIAEFEGIAVADDTQNEQTGDNMEFSPA